MLGLWIEKGRCEQKTGLAPPRRPAGWALLKTRLAGVCRTDLELLRGYFDFSGIPGHEFCAEVIEADDGALVGKRVVGEINVPCGGCSLCERGMGNHCPSRKVLGIDSLDGVMAEYFVLPEGNLHVLPDSTPDEAAVFAEPLAAACRIPEQLGDLGGVRCLVVGAGKLGQLVARVLARAGARVAAVAKYEGQKVLLREVGIETLDGSNVPAAGFDVVVEASGSPAGFELARMAVRPLGTIVLKSTYHGRLDVDASMLVVDEITVVGSRCGPFPAALELLQEGLDPGPLVERVLPAKSLSEAFELASAPGALKVLVDFTK